MGTNLLIVMPGTHQRRRRARRHRLAADADVGRSQGDPDRGADGALRRARAALELAGHERGSELDDAASRARRPTTSPFAPGRCRAGVALIAVRRRGRHQGRRARADRRRQAVRRRTPTPSGSWCASRTSPSRSSACSPRRGSRRWGRTTTTRSSCRCTTFGAKIQGGLHNYLNGTIFVGAQSPQTTPRAPRSRSRRSCAIATTSADGADDDFFIRNLAEIANAQQEGTKTMTTLLASVAAVSLRGRRHRHHEHHAGERDRADARDRHAHGRRRQAAQHPAAVPGRGAHALDDGRHHRRHPRFARRAPARRQVRLADAGARRHHHHRRRLLGCRRHRLRALSRAQGVAARSHRRASGTNDVSIAVVHGAGQGRCRSSEGSPPPHKNQPNSAGARQHRRGASARGRGARAFFAAAQRLGGLQALHVEQHSRRAGGARLNTTATGGTSGATGTTTAGGGVGGGNTNSIANSNWNTYDSYNFSITASQTIWDAPGQLARWRQFVSTAEAQEATERATRLSTTLTVRQLLLRGAREQGISSRSRARRWPIRTSI